MVKKCVLFIIVINFCTIITAQENNMYFPADFNLNLNYSLSNYSKDNERGRMNPNDIRDIFLFGIVPLLYSGLSIVMREAVYTNNPLDNWMGSYNSCATLTVGGAAAGFLLSYLISSGMDDLFTSILYILGSTVIGGVVGSLVHFCVPAVSTAFKENRILYYTAPTISTVFGILAITYTIKSK